MNDSDAEPQRSAAYRIGRGMLGTVPIVLASSMALSMNLTGPLFAHDHVEPVQKKPGISPEKTPKTRVVTTAFGRTPEVELTAATVTTASAAPATYVVKSGDTVSSIAERFGLSTASVLALNGLSWKSTIFPGQQLSLSAARASAPTGQVTQTVKPVAATSSGYTIARGDTMSSIAKAHGVSTSALLAANGLTWSSIIYPGQKLSIPAAGTATAAVATTAATTAATTTATPTAAATSTPTSTAASQYVIKTGDTLSSIAKAHGTTVDKLLSANGLSWTSTIYAGKRLTLPSTAPATPTVTAESNSGTVVSSSLDTTQQANARTIIRVGHSLGVSDYGIVIALAAAAQESGLENLPSGDRDSVGLFQQRPSQGWGTRAQLTDTTYAARLFFGGSRNPNVGKTRGLLDIRGWSSMTVTQAAQAVQNSAYPTAYAKWESSAKSWLATL